MYTKNQKLCCNKLSNVQGPARVADTQGEGYGGGASYKDNDGETLGVGLSGLVLIEIGGS